MNQNWKDLFDKNDFQYPGLNQNEICLQKLRFVCKNWLNSLRWKYASLNKLHYDDSGSYSIRKIKTTMSFLICLGWCYWRRSRRSQAERISRWFKNRCRWCHTRYWKTAEKDSKSPIYRVLVIDKSLDLTSSQYAMVDLRLVSSKIRKIRILEKISIYF